jgi:hypothetical protein
MTLHLVEDEISGQDRRDKNDRIVIKVCLKKANSDKSQRESSFIRILIKRESH